METDCLQTNITIALNGEKKKGGDFFLFKKVNFWVINLKTPRNVICLSLIV